MDQLDGGGGGGASSTLGNLPDSGPLPPHLVVKKEQGKTTDWLQLCQDNLILDGFKCETQ